MEHSDYPGCTVTDFYSTGPIKTKCDVKFERNAAGQSEITVTYKTRDQPDGQATTYTYKGRDAGDGHYILWSFHGDHTVQTSALKNDDFHGLATLRKISSDGVFEGHWWENEKKEPRGTWRIEIKPHDQTNI